AGYQADILHAVPVAQPARAEADALLASLQRIRLGLERLGAAGARARHSPPAARSPLPRRCRPLHRRRPVAMRRPLHALIVCACLAGGCAHVDADAARLSLLQADIEFDRDVAQRGLEAWVAVFAP